MARALLRLVAYWALATGFTSTSVACASFSSAAADVPTGTADAGAPGSDGGDAAVFRDDFEGNTIACSGWRGNSVAQVAVEPTGGRSGAACRLCFGSAEANVARSVDALRGSTLSFETWVRAGPTAGSKRAILYVDLFGDGGAFPLGSSVVDLSTKEWRPVTVVGDRLGASRATLYLTIEKGIAGDCILFDDVVLLAQ